MKDRSLFDDLSGLSLFEPARLVIPNHLQTGYQLAHEWQQKNGELMQGQRLIPKIPFMLGGDYETENLFALDAVRRMRYRADIWRQTRDLLEGARTQLKIQWWRCACL